MSDAQDAWFEYSLKRPFRLVPVTLAGRGALAMCFGVPVSLMVLLGTTTSDFWTFRFGSSAIFWAAAVAFYVLMRAKGHQAS